MSACLNGNMKLETDITYLQITTNCLSESWIESCIQKYTIVYQESQNTGKKNHNLQNSNAAILKSDQKSFIDAMALV